MSLTVVCATMLAATTCKQLREETRARVGTRTNPEEVREAILSEASAMASVVTPTHQETLCVDADCASAGPEALPLFRKLAALAEEAIKASIFCTCETSGRNSRTPHFVECRTCRISCCRNCLSQVAGYNMTFHDTREVTLSVAEHCHGSFQAKLRDALPSSLKLSEGGWRDLENLGEDRHRVRSIRNCTFLLHRIVSLPRLEM